MILPARFADWHGTLREAITAITELIVELHVPTEPPTERALRDWRNEALLTRDGRKFTSRNLLEAIRAKQLRDREIPVSIIKEHLRGFSDGDLLAAITKPDAAIPTSVSREDEAERAVLLLASGVLKQFREVQEGRIVGVAENTPLALRQAQAQLARLYILYGREDEVASVHELLVRCRRALSEWAPPPVATHEQYANAVLIDPEYRVPSEDCEAIAELGGHLEDLVETQMHGQLMRALGKLDEVEREGAYTLVRRFIAQHPLATRNEFREIRNDPHITPEVAAFLDRVYSLAHADLAVGGVVRRCERCRGYIRGNDKCVLASCRYLNGKSTVSIPVPHTDAFVARPEILKFWCDPAQEELRMYHELCNVYGEAVRLYPHLDRCDVSIGNEIGIDVKDYRDPVRLARKLNRGLGGLRMYPRMILGVATRRAIDKEYIPRLKEHLLPTNRDALNIESVENVIKRLKTEVRYG